MKSYYAMKRVFDISFSIVLMIVFCPLMLLTAIFIRLETEGPAIYTQERIGKGLKHFKMFKFRSMYIGADQQLSQLTEFNIIKDGPAFKMENDPRITRVGHFIRKTSIDELPQLINILKGEMSFVGPRPPLPEEVSRYTKYQMQRLAVKPGLTCYWQCNGRNKLSFQEWMRLDLKYIEEQGIRTDIKILFKTVLAVITMNGAE